MSYYWSTGFSSNYIFELAIYPLNKFGGRDVIKDGKICGDSHEKRKSFHRLVKKNFDH